jgi:hypothetical protein
MIMGMLSKLITKTLAAAAVLAWSMSHALASTQLDQLEALLAKQREQQAQLGQLLKQTQAEVGRGPSWAMPVMPELGMQNVLFSAGALAAVLILCAMWWLWKNRMPASVAYRPVPEPYAKDAAFKTSAFKSSDYKDSSLTPAAFKVPLQDSSWAESWATATSPLGQKPSAELTATQYTAGEQPDISLDELESGFGASVMDFDLSDFDHIGSADPFIADPFTADTTMPGAQLQVPLTNTVVPASLELAPLTVADFELTAPIGVDSEEFTDSTAVFIAGEVDHRDSAFDLLKFDANGSAVQQNAPSVAAPKPRASAKIDSEVPSKYDELPAEVLRPVVTYIAPVVNANPGAAFAFPTDIEFSGSAFGQLQLNIPPAILPYPHALNDDDATFATQLDLAREFAALGQVDEAELLCQEVFTNGTEPMREYALYILTRLPEFKRK